jgi:DNA replication protein DnaC
MLTHETTEKLYRMRLSAMAEAFKEQLAGAEADDHSFEERFGLIVDRQWTARRNRRLARLLKEARLRLPACPEDIDYRHPRGLDRSVMRSLLTCAWLDAHRNVIITGPTGVGKTFIACALGERRLPAGLPGPLLPGLAAPGRPDGGQGGRHLPPLALAAGPDGPPCP